MTPLNDWLKRATRQLSQASAAQVRNEIQEHYESARETAIAGGATAEEAGRAALTALGDPASANCQYRKVLLTSAEARMLRDANWESRVICGRPSLKRMLLVLPAALVLASVVLFFRGSRDLASTLLAFGAAVGMLFTAPFLPIYTPARARVFRGVKWAVWAIALLAFGPNALRWSWLLASSVWPLVWIEWTRASIRRKLRVAEWPRHLYL
jgi:hypothetical protein